MLNILIFIIYFYILSCYAFEQNFNQNLNTLVFVKPNVDTIIKLKSMDIYKYLGSDCVSNGLVSQTTWVYSNYNYLPLSGKKLNPGDNITDLSNRFVYKINSNIKNKLLDKLFFVNQQLQKFYVLIVPDSGIFMSSNFLFDSDGWTITGSNPLKNQRPTHYTYNNGFICATEDYVNVKSWYHDNTDQSLWYFEAPNKFYQDWSLAYDKTIEFELSSLVGNFKEQNLNNESILIIKSDTQTIYYYKNSLENYWNGNRNKWIIKLNEKNFYPIIPSDLFVKLLHNITSIKILGDWTNGYETVCLHKFEIKLNNIFY